MDDCVKQLYEYMNAYNWPKEVITACINETASATSKTPEIVCSFIVKKLKKIEKKCVKGKIVLKDYQLDAVHRMMKQRGILLAFEVGSGKTLTAIAISQCLLRQAAFFRKKINVTIVTPASLIDNFKKEMPKFGVSPNNSNYTFYSIDTYYRRLKSGVVSCKNTLLIIDEAHALKKDYLGEFNPYEKLSKFDLTRAQIFIKCAKLAWKVVILTGTPIDNAPYDVVNLIAMARGEQPLTYRGWSNLLRNETRFNDYFGCYISFYSPPRMDYPSWTISIDYVPMTLDYFEKYSDVEKALHPGKSIEPSDIEISEKRNAFLHRLRQAANGILPNLKADKAVKIMENGLKTLFYSEYEIYGVNVVAKKLDEKGIKYQKITGKIPKTTRQAIVNTYNSENPDKPKILLVTKAGREGLDLKGTRQIIILEPGWNPSIVTQIIGRGVRYKSHEELPPEERNVTVYRLLLVKPMHVATLLLADEIAKRNGREIYTKSDIDQALTENMNQSNAEIKTLPKQLQNQSPEAKTRFQKQLEESTPEQIEKMLGKGLTLEKYNEILNKRQAALDAQDMKQSVDVQLFLTMNRKNEKNIKMYKRLIDASNKCHKT